MPTAPLSRNAEEFLSWLEVERGRSPRTLSSYRRDLGAYQAYLGAGPTGVSMDQATSSDVAAYVASLRQTHSASSVARALSTMRGFHRFLVEEDLVPTDPTAVFDVGVVMRAIISAAGWSQWAPVVLGFLVPPAMVPMYDPGLARSRLHNL